MKEIFRTIVGSRLYNLHSETSDTDVKGFCLPDASDLLGLSDTARAHWEQPNDTVIYSVAKFFTLLAKGNPTLVELLFVPTDAILLDTAAAREIRNFCRKTFITKALVPSYMGYVRDQYKRVAERKAQNNRATALEKFGFDTKSGSHVYRLAVQATELMTTGKCSPKMIGDDREIALAIKRGDYNYDRTIDTLKLAIKGMEVAESNCKLPEKPDMESANDYIKLLHRRVVLDDYGSRLTSPVE
jgi:hypothetical protein